MIRVCWDGNGWIWEWQLNEMEVVAVGDNIVLNCSFVGVDMQQEQ